MLTFEDILRIAKRGNEVAKFLCAAMQENGWNTAIDKEAAAVTYREIARGMPLASYALARLLMADAETRDEAYEWAKLAAEGNLPEGAIFLGVIYDQGIGVPRDACAARYWYERGAAAGDASGYFLLASQWIDDRGRISRKDLAAPLLTKAVCGGIHGAAPFLATILIENGDAKSIADALAMLERGAQAQDFGCLMKLSTIYGSGVPGIVPDQDLALDYLTRAQGRAGVL